MIPKEMIDAAAQLLIDRLGPENVARLTFPKEAATTGVILEDIMEAALTAALSVQWEGMESYQWIAGFNAGLEAAARHCERNALSAVPVEIRSLKRPLPPPPAQE